MGRRERRKLLERAVDEGDLPPGREPLAVEEERQQHGRQQQPHEAHHADFDSLIDKPIRRRALRTWL